MMYNSTRDNSVRVTSSQAIIQGISKDGGLFVPQKFPALGIEEILALLPLSYAERAVFVMAKYLPDFTYEEVLECSRLAYNTGRFRSADIAPLYRMDSG